MANSTKKTKTKVDVKKEKDTKFANITQNLKGKKKKDTAIVTNEVKGKEKKPKKPKKKRLIFLITFMVILIAGALACLSFCIYIIATAPVFDPAKLLTSSSTNVYDINGELIAKLGTERRENVTYDELPEIVIDAIVATEDSKFFQHSGIDLLRFGKAVVGQLLGHSDAGGGSTLTMQLAKLNYSNSESSGIEGIIRKFKDIYMALFKIEKNYSKQEILEFYVNRAYFGTGAYGIQQAAETYFGKTVGELNLAEAATLAGLFQAPNYYQAYSNTEGAEMRRNQVLGLMYRHGYITWEEAETAIAMPLADMLSGYDYTYSEHQGFIDTMWYDVKEKTGYYPTDVSMNIYTTLDPARQEAVNGVMNGTTYRWKSDDTKAGIVVTDVHTGAVVAVGARRDSKALAWNYATQNKRHPGSIAKPIFDYGPAIEYAGWGTGTFVMDDFYTYSNGQSINNVDGGYYGIMTAKTALGNSRNIPALQAFQATTQQQKYDFVTGLGITPELHDQQILESASIGAFEGTNPMEMSAAYGAFARGGYYIEPYTFTKIEYTDTDNETYVHTPTRTKVMSEETAWMINYMLTYACSAGLTGGCAGVPSSNIASKTGTSSEDYSVINMYRLPNNTIRDSWQVIYSPDYSLALWYGYDQNTNKHYMTDVEGWTSRAIIGNVLTPKIFKRNATWSRPSGVTAATVEFGTNMLASEFTPANLRVTEYYTKGTEPTEVSFRYAQLSNVSNLTYTTVGNQIQLSWNGISTPKAIDEGYLESYFNENYKRWAEKNLKLRLAYNESSIGTVTYDVYVKNDDGSLTFVGSTPSTTFNTSITNATSATFVVKSAYTIFKDNASSGVEINVRVSPGFVPSTPDTPGDGGDETDDDKQDQPTDGDNSTTENDN